MKIDPVKRNAEINAWLSTPEKDFNAGLILFDIYSGNGSLYSIIKRKSDLKLLTYQLKKIIGTHLEPSPLQAHIQVHELKTLTPRELNDLTPADNHPENKSVLLIEDKFKKLDPKTLPVKLQAIHARIAEAYKYQRSYHEKMKLVQTDLERAEHRAKDIEYDDIIAKGWDAIDTFLKNGEAETQPPAEKSAFDISRDVNSSRAYITKNLNTLAALSEKKKPARIAEIQKRIEVLIQYKASVRQETFNALLQAGIITSNSQLVIETR